MFSYDRKGNADTLVEMPTVTLADRLMTSPLGGVGHHDLERFYH